MSDNLGPRGMYDMSGWEPIGCEDSDDLRASRQVTVASSLTDPRANYSSGVTFTEWWADDQPLLRDYLYPDERPCAHYAWTPVSRVQAIEAAEDHADQVAFDAWRERGR